MPSHLRLRWMPFFLVRLSGVQYRMHVMTTSYREFLQKESAVLQCFTRGYDCNSR